MSTQLCQALGTGGVGWKALPPSAGHLHTTLVVLGARRARTPPQLWMSVATPCQF
ncbi:MAG: hypothetical protein IPK82_23965 [Polyangiaceae bacterium]|nr:hypothetical protein [Polyangiaceae bacterium]